MAKYREKFIVGRITSRLAPVGSADWRGIGSVASGTVATTVSAAAAVSGAVVLLTPYMGTNLMASSLQVALAVGSVAAGQFMVFCTASVPVTGPVPFAWAVIK